MQQVCVTETNEDGCVGPEVCLDVWVEDDVAHVAHVPATPYLLAYPNPVQETLVVQCEACRAGEKMQVWNSMGAMNQAFIWEGGERQSLDVRSLHSGLHMLQVGASTTSFIVK